jgi:hypothetical protein
MNYDLTHFTQEPSQLLYTLQDDEALVLYALIRCMRLKTIIECGTIEPTSTINFLKALDGDGNLISITSPNFPISSNDSRHSVFAKDMSDLSISEFPSTPIDLIYFDGQRYPFQMRMYLQLREWGLLSEKVILAIHDTNCHPVCLLNGSQEVTEGFVHSSHARLLVNDFNKIGFQSFCLHTSRNQHSSHFPCRHGLTLMQRFKNLAV